MCYCALTVPSIRRAVAVSGPSLYALDMTQHFCHSRLCYGSVTYTSMKWVHMLSGIAHLPLCLHCLISLSFALGFYWLLGAARERSTCAISHFTILQHWGDNIFNTLEICPRKCLSPIVTVKVPLPIFSSNCQHGELRHLLTFETDDYKTYLQYGHKRMLFWKE